MGLIARLAETRSNPENPSTNLSNPASWLTDLFSGGKSWTGMTVNQHTALTYATVYACVRILAESVGSLPFILYRNLHPGKERARDHYLYDLIRTRPNPEIPGPMPFYETLQGHLGTWGNAYAEIEFKGGRPVALWILPPDRTVAVRENGQKWIVTRKNDGQDVRIRAEKVLHIPGWGYDGVMGYSPITLMKQGIGLGLAAEKFGSTYFSNGATPSGALKHKGELSEEAAKRLKDSVEAAHRGLDQSHRIMVLEDGLEWQAMGLPPGDSQFLESRKFQVEEIARAYRIPPVLLGHTEKATSWGTGIEQFQVMFVAYTLRPWFVRWEGAMKHSLILPSDQDELYIEILAEALLRGDIKTRYEAYRIARQWGWSSADDIRFKEGENALPDGQGEIYLVPMNMIPATELRGLLGDGENRTEEEIAAALDDLDSEEKESLRAATEATVVRNRIRATKAYRSIFEEIANLTVTREVKAVRRAVKKTLGERGATDLYTWLDEFYEGESSRISAAFLNQLTAYYILVRATVADELGLDDPGDEITDAEARQIRDYADAMGGRLAGGSHAQLTQIMRDSIDQAAMEDGLLERLDEWDETKADKIGRRESAQAGNAFAVFAYAAASVTTLRWVTLDPNCPFCNTLAGATVKTGKPFVEGTTSVEVEGEDPMFIRNDTGHPPLHDGCDCIVLAGG